MLFQIVVETFKRLGLAVVEGRSLLVRVGNLSEQISNFIMPVTDAGDGSANG
jgi:hypothetical protein